MVVKYKNGEKFCGNCGNRLNKNLDENSNYQEKNNASTRYKETYIGKNKKKRYITNVGILCFIIGIIIGILCDNILIGLSYGFGLWIGILIEMVPWLIAIERNHKDEKIIFWISIFFGYLVIPWILCIIWACQVPKVDEVVKSENTTDFTNKYEQLEKLAKLKELGAISNEEFESEKSKILK